MAHRRAAAAALGAQAAAGPLLGQATAAAPSLRHAVVGALGGCTGTAAAVALATRVREDDNPDIQGAALLALAKVDPEEALALARRLARPGDIEDDRRSDAAYALLGRLGAPGDLRPLLRPQPRRLSSSALRAAARLVQRQPAAEERARLGARVARVAEARRDDPDLRTRQAMLGVLREVGDAQSLPLLAQLSRRTTLPSVKAGVAAATFEIHARQQPAALPSPNAEAARLEAIEARLDALEAAEADLHDRP